MESAHATTVKFSRPWPAPRGAMAICGVAGFGRMGGPTVRHRVHSIHRGVGRPFAFFSADRRSARGTSVFRIFWKVVRNSSLFEVRLTTAL